MKVCPKCGSGDIKEIQLLTSTAFTCVRCKDEGLNYLDNPGIEEVSVWKAYDPTHITLPSPARSGESFVITLPPGIVIDLDKFRAPQALEYIEISIQIEDNASEVMRKTAEALDKDKKPGVYWGEICDMP